MTYPATNLSIWPGARHNQLRVLYGLFPSSWTYVEPFGNGDGAVFLNRPAGGKLTDREVYNCADGRVREVLGVMQDAEMFEKFHDTLTSLPYGADLYARAGDWQHHARPEVAAAGTVVLRNLRRFGKGPTIGADGLGEKRLKEEWRKRLEDMEVIHEQLEFVHIGIRSPIRMIQDEDGPETLFYCDPGMFGITDPKIAHRHHNEGHEDLVRVLLDVKGSVVLSGNEQPGRYRELTKAGWVSDTYADLESKMGKTNSPWKVSRVNRGAKRVVGRDRVESVWRNPKASQCGLMPRLFDDNGKVMECG